MNFFRYVKVYEYNKNGSKTLRAKYIGWKNYDEQLRLKIAGNPSASWGEIDFEFWLIYVHNNTQAGVQLNTRTQPIYKCYAFNYGGSCRKSNCTDGHCCLR